MRSYRLYVTDSDKFEVVPTGWSFLAALMQFVWAFWSGTLGKWLLLCLPGLALIVLAGTFVASLAYFALAYLLLVLYVYFPAVAFSWRERVLVSEGYRLEYSTKARTSKAALNQYLETIA